MFTVSVEDIGHAIQLALAPVFLLTGIAAMLGVMTGRLARIIDRGRFLTETPDLGERTMNQLQAREFAASIAAATSRARRSRRARSRRC